MAMVVKGVVKGVVKVKGMVVVKVVVVNESGSEGVKENGNTLLQHTP